MNNVKYVHRFIVPLIFDWLAFVPEYDTLPLIANWVENGFSLMNLIAQKHPSLDPLSHSNSIFYKMAQVCYPHSFHIDIQDLIKPKLSTGDLQESLIHVYVGDYGVDFVFDATQNNEEMYTPTLLNTLGGILSPIFNKDKLNLVPVLELEIYQTENYIINPITKDGENAFNFADSPWNEFYFPKTWIIGKRTYSASIAIAYILAASYSLVLTYKSLSSVLKIGELYTHEIFEKLCRSYGSIKRNIIGLEKEYMAFIHSTLPKFKASLLNLDIEFQKLLVDVYGVESSPNLFIFWSLENMITENHRVKLWDHVKINNIESKDELSKTILNELKYSQKLLVKSLDSYVSSVVASGYDWYKMHQANVNTWRTLISIFISTLAVVGSILSVMLR